MREGFSHAWDRLKHVRRNETEMIKLDLLRREDASYLGGSHFSKLTNDIVSARSNEEESSRDSVLRN